MERFRVKYFVIATLLVVLACSETALASQSSYEYNDHPKPIESPPPPPPPPPPPSPPTCRKLQQLCIGYGDYDCCEGLSCTAFSPDNPIGVGICTPLTGPPTPKQTCQNKHQLCHSYGQYSCCAGLSCVHPRTLPPFAGVEPDKLKLPPGMGICEPIKL